MSATFVLTLFFQSLPTERILVHSSSQQMLASAVGTRAAARENDRYNSTRVLFTSLPSSCRRQKILNKNMLFLSRNATLLGEISLLGKISLLRGLELNEVRSGHVYQHSLRIPEVTLHPEDV